jgi:hypothetical protein
MNIKIVPINSDEELKKVLAIQKAVHDRAVEEVKEISTTSDPAEFLKRASELIERYARYATLTEFDHMPSLADGEKWGATFGVATLCGVLICRAAEGMLRTEEDLIGVFIKFLLDMDNNKKKQVKIDNVYAVFAMLSEAHGLVWFNRGENLQLTVTGRRVLLHLLDASKFVEEMVEATANFQ